MSAGRSNEQAAGEAELSFETLMGGILTRFLNLPVSQIDKDIENSIGRVAEFMGLDEGLLVQWTADPSQARPTHFWTIAGSLPAQNGSGTVAVPWVHSQLLLGKVTAIARAADLPSEAAADREFLQQSGRKSLIAVPIKIGGAVIGGLAFATLRTEMQWSAGLMRRLKLVAEIFAGVLERKKRNLELDIQLQFESLLKEISSRFANVRADQVQSTIEEAQRLCCESLCLDRSSLFQCSAADPGTMLLTHLYQRPDLPYPVLKRQDPVSKAESYWRLSEPGYLGEYTRIDCKEMYPWFYEQLRHGKTVVVPDLQALGDEAATDKKNLSSFGTKSSVVVPLFAGYEWLGILTFGAVSQRRDWTESLVSRFQFLADLFTNALARKQADEALCESENRYRGIFEAESDGVLVGDLGSGMFLDANAAAQKMYGYTREEFLGLKLEDISAEPNKTLKSVAAREMHVPLRWHRRKDGSVFPVEVSANFVTHGTRSIYVGAIRDISERKRTEDALRESEERLTLATESAGAGLWSVKLETEEVWLSPRMRELLQLTADEEINYLTLIRAVHPADRDQLLRASRGTVEEGKEFVLEHRVPLPDGKERWIIARGRLHCDAAGKPDRLMGASTDITHRKLAQQRIRESEQRFRQLAENIREVFYVMDPRIPAMEYVSPVYEEVWGRSCQSRYDNPLAFLDAVHPEDRERVRQAFATASTAATVMDLEYRIIRPDGSIRWVRDRAFPVLDESGTVTRLTGLAEDITERKGLEQELNDKLDELEAARDDLKNSNDSLEIERTRYRELFESAPDAYCVTDLKGVVVEANRAAEDLFNFSRAELLGNPLAIFISMPDHQSFFSQLNGLAKRGLQSVARWEMDIQPVKAAPLPVAVTVVVARDAHNQTIGLRWLFRDITERKLAESRLRESEARFRTAADSAPVLIWISGTDKLCTFFNQTWLDFTGRTAEQEMGDGWTTGVHPEDLPGCMKTYDESFAAHRPFTMQYRLRRHDGEYRWLLDHGVPRYEADGSVRRFHWFLFRHDGSDACRQGAGEERRALPPDCGERQRFHLGSRCQRPVHLHQPIGGAYSGLRSGRTGRQNAFL